LIRFELYILGNSALG